MIEIIPQIIGLLAVTSFLLSYQQKKRNSIIIWNVISRSLYIIQYILLGAFSGAVLDILGAISSVLAQKKNTSFIKKHIKTVILFMNGTIIIAGLIISFMNKSLLDVFPIIGVLLHTGAFWITNEKTIRIISLAGSPFWFVYNLLSKAYGSSVGDLLTMVSIITAMIKFKDFKKEKSNV